MKNASTKTAIEPFFPRPFPPRRIRNNAFGPLLKKANAALEEYAETLARVPSPDSLLATLDVLEAIASLSSQNIHTSVKLYFTGKIHPTPATLTKLAPIDDYIHGLKWLRKKKKGGELDHKILCTLHQIVKKSNSSPHDLGCYRDRQNWIGPHLCKIEEAYFYPPAPKQVRPLMQELFAYAAKTTKEPLLQLAILFAQLLIIHPFMDGNGRIARALIPSFLWKKNRIPSFHFYLSAYFKKNRLNYFRTLYNTTEENAWEDWIAFFLKGILAEAKRQRQTLEKIASLYDNLAKEGYIENEKTKRFLFANPVFTLASFRKAKGSIAELKQLLNAGWVHKSARGDYLFSSLFKILAG